MDVAAIIVAIVAIVVGVLLAGFGILIQFLTHKATTEQSERVADSVAQFRADMQGLVRELKGITDTLVAVQREQFSRMLDAFVTRPGAAADAAEKASQSAVTAEEVGGMLEALREEVEKVASPGPVLSRLEALERRFDDIRESSAAAARFAGAASRPSFPDNPYLRFGLADEGSIWVDIDPAVVSPGGRVTISYVGGSQGVFSELVDCEVVTPDGRVLTAPWPSSAAALVFPDHFPYASTELEGTYRVTARRQPLFSPTERGHEQVSRGSFRVRSGGADD